MLCTNCTKAHSSFAKTKANKADSASGSDCGAGSLSTGERSRGRRAPDLLPAQQLHPAVEPGPGETSAHVQRGPPPAEPPAPPAQPAQHAVLRGLRGNPARRVKAVSCCLATPKGGDRNYIQTVSRRWSRSAGSCFNGGYSVYSSRERINSPPLSLLLSGGRPWDQSLLGDGECVKCEGFHHISGPSAQSQLC